MSETATLIIGVGNRDRGDDAAGPCVCDLVDSLTAGAIHTVVLETSALDLVNHWHDDDRVVIVDAGRPAGDPGRVTEHDGLADQYLVPGSASTHAIDVAGGVELARAMDRLPAALTIIGIEGESFEFGAPLSESVRRSVAEIATRLGGRGRRRAISTIA